MRLYILTNSCNEDCESSWKLSVILRRWLSADESLSFTVNPSILRCISLGIYYMHPKLMKNKSYLKKNKSSRRLTVDNDYVDNGDHLPVRSGELIGHPSSLIVYHRYHRLSSHDRASTFFIFLRKATGMHHVRNITLRYWDLTRTHEIYTREE